MQVSRASWLEELAKESTTACPSALMRTLYASARELPPGGTRLTASVLAIPPPQAPRKKRETRIVRRMTVPPELPPRGGPGGTAEGALHRGCQHSFAVRAHACRWRP